MVAARYRSVIWSVLPGSLLLLTACNTMPTLTEQNPTGETLPTQNTLGLTVVRTAAKVHVQAQLIGGDDVIFFGKENAVGVAYLVPSAGDQTARQIPNGDKYNFQAFAVSGKKVALTQNNFQVSIFDAATGATSDVPLTDVRLARIPVGAREFGHIQAGANVVACICDKSSVTDGKPLKFIDISGAAPVVTSFTQYPPGIQAISQVAVDPTLKRIVAVAGQSILSFDIANPNSAPLQFDTTQAANNNGDGIDENIQVETDNGIVLFRAGNSERATVLSTFNGQYASLTTKKCANGMALRGSLLAFFVSESSDDSAGLDLRSGIAHLTDAATTFADFADTVAKNTLDDGILGYGQTADVTKDGKYFFIAGSSSLGQAERLQVSTGGKFALLADPLGEDKTGVAGTDVNCNGSVVCFKSGSQENATVAYIK